MTTFRRTTEVPPPPGHGVNGYAPFNVGTPLSDTKTAFRAVNAGTLLEIMGYTTAGLSDMGVSEDETAMIVYKWHTWLRRMNAYMRDNEAQYLEIMRQNDPDTTLPKTEYFLGGFSSLTAQSNNAETAPLGPLLPGDKGTFINALSKGAEKTTGAGKRVAKALTQFLQDMDKLATHLAPSSRVPGTTPKSGGTQPTNVYVQHVKSAVQPWQDSFQGSVIKFPMNPAPNNTGGLPVATAAITPLAAASAAGTTGVAATAAPVSTASTIAAPVTIPVTTAASVPVSASSAAGLFTNTPTYTTIVPSDAKSSAAPLVTQVVAYAKQLLERIKQLPMWAHVLLLMILFAVVLKGRRTARSYGGTAQSFANTGPISKFTIPPVDPFV